MVDISFTDDFSKEYDFLRKLGEGQYGSVYKAINKKNGEMRACKIVRRKYDYMRELDHLVTLSECFGVMKLMRAVFTTSDLCFEFKMGSDSLSKHMKKKTNYGVRDKILYSLGIIKILLMTVQNMHENGIIHRDIKGDNIVMTKESEGEFPWLIDFGMSKRMTHKDDDVEMACYDLVTCTHRAPELWRQDQTPGNREKVQYTSSVDEWSIGCVLFECLFGESPFDGDSEKDVRMRIAQHIALTDQESSLKLWGNPVKKIDILERIDLLMSNGSTGTKRPLNSDFLSYKSTFELADIVKRMLKGLLEPNPLTRMTSSQALCLLGCRYTFQKPKTFVPVYSEEIVMDSHMKIDILDTMERFFVTFDRSLSNPQTAHLATFLWLQCVLSKRNITKTYCLETIFLACIRIASEYEGMDKRFIKKIRKNLEKRTKRSPRMEVSCLSKVLMSTNGRVWIDNPANYRNEIPYTFCSWGNSDKLIFCATMTLLNQKLTIPDPREVVDMAIALSKEL